MKRKSIVPFHEGLATVCKGVGAQRRCGGIDPKGTEKIALAYKVLEWNRGCETQRPLGVVDRSGKMIVPPQFLAVGRDWKGFARATGAFGLE